MTKKLSQMQNGDNRWAAADGQIGSGGAAHRTASVHRTDYFRQLRNETGMEDLPAYNADAAETSILMQANSGNDD
jgi:hypothetical protein